MADVESAIIDLVKETVEGEYSFPSDEDIENTVETKAAEYLDRHLGDTVSEALEHDDSVRLSLAEALTEFMEVEKVARQADVNALREEMLREMLARSFGYQAGALKDRIRDRLARLFRLRRRNGRKVCSIWTVLF